MRTYTYKEVEHNIKVEYNRLIKEKLDAGVMIESTYNNDYIYFDDSTKISIDRYGNGEYVAVGDLEYYQLSYCGHYVTKEDYPKITKMREARKERKHRSDYRLVKSIPDSLIEKLKTIPGFKKVTKDNLVIIKNNAGDRWLMNCDTNKVMEFAIWRYSGAEFKESYTSKKSFNAMMEDL